MVHLSELVSSVHGISVSSTLNVPMVLWFVGEINVEGVQMTYWDYWDDKFMDILKSVEYRGKKSDVARKAVVEWRSKDEKKGLLARAARAKNLANAGRNGEEIKSAEMRDFLQSMDGAPDELFENSLVAMGYNRIVNNMNACENKCSKIYKRIKDEEFPLSWLPQKQFLGLFLRDVLLNAVNAVHLLYDGSLRMVYGVKGRELSPVTMFEMMSLGDYLIYFTNAVINQVGKEVGRTRTEAYLHNNRSWLVKLKGEKDVLGDLVRNEEWSKDTDEFVYESFREFMKGL